MRARTRAPKGVAAGPPDALVTRTGDERMSRLPRAHPESLPQPRLTDESFTISMAWVFRALSHTSGAVPLQSRRSCVNCL